MSSPPATQKSQFLIEIEKLIKNRKFRSVKANNSGIYNSYLISGSKIKWKAGVDFVYSYELRIAGNLKEVKDFISGLSKKDLGEVGVTEGQGSSAPMTTKVLMNHIITKKNHNISAKGAKSPTPAQLYALELEQYKELKQLKQNKANNLPSIDEIYEAFLVYKNNPSTTGNTNVRSKKRLSNIGELYTGLQENEIMNIYGYSAPDGKVLILKVEDPNQNTYTVNDKTMYKVPNYRLVSSLKKDVEYALKDLVEQNEVELSKKEINETLKQWTELKKRVTVESNSNANRNGTKPTTKDIVSPKTISLESNGNSTNFKIPRAVKHNVKIIDK